MSFSFFQRDIKYAMKPQWTSTPATKRYIGNNGCNSHSEKYSEPEKYKEIQWNYDKYNVHDLTNLYTQGTRLINFVNLDEVSHSRAPSFPSYVNLIFFLQ